MATSLISDYPWTHAPLIVGAPSLKIALAPLAVAISRAGGLGFIGAGNGPGDLANQLEHAKNLLTDHPIRSSPNGILPIGVGIVVFNADISVALDAIAKNLPAAVWLFAPEKNADLEVWSRKIREATAGKTKIWIQIGTVADALEVAKLCRPEVLVAQGADAGGHGLERGAGIISLLPEIHDALLNAGLHGIHLVAAGGIVEGRGVAAAFALRAEGVVMGTRFLAAKETQIAKGYQDDVIRSNDGGISTIRSKLYDTLRGTTDWPGRYDGRGIINESFHDAENGEVTEEENRRKYQDALKKGDEGWGVQGRLTAYAGTGVGLITKVMPAGEIVEEIRGDFWKIQSRLSYSASKL